MPFTSIEKEITDEEFYKVCSEELGKIHSYDITDEEKLKLRYCIYDVVIRYEEGKECRIENEKNFKKLGESLGQLERSFYQMRESIGKINEVGKIALINAQIASAKMKDAVKLINKTKTQVIETTKDLRAKLDAKNTLVKITMGMVSQKPEDKK
jgi:hypothetical protein